MAGGSRTGSALGEFLRSARGRADPERVGLPFAGPRRVPGLRREEVAVLAGVSANYYARLEQGRERRPSPSVLDALGQVFDLDPDARAHLYRLAGAAPREPDRAQIHVRTEMSAMIEEWTSTPAMVLSENLDVLAYNRLAAALHCGFAELGNLAVMTFLDPAGRTFYRDWDQAARAVVAHLRLAHGRRPHDPALVDVLGRLSRTGAPFDELWRAQVVRERTHAVKRFTHPRVGPLELTYQSFDVRGSTGQQLLVHRAEAGSASADALRLLSGLAATQVPGG